MSNLLRSEWIKFRSVRSNLFVLLAALGVMVFGSLVGALQAKDHGTDVCQPAPPGSSASAQADPDSLAMCGEGSVLVHVSEVHVTDVTGGTVFAGLMFAVLGVQVIAQEYRFSTIRTTFTATPHRLRVVGAKAVLVAAVAAVGATINVAIALALGELVSGGLTIDGPDRRVAWGIVVFSTLWALAGMGVGALVRQPVAGIVIIAGEALVLESLLLNLVHSAGPWLPFFNGLQMTQATAIDPNLRSVFAGGAFFAAVCLACLVAGAFLVERRDA